MKTLLIFLFVVFSACKRSAPVEPAESAEEPGRDTISPQMTSGPKPVAKTFSNARFRGVTAVREGDSIRISGRAQVFEAAFSWVVEDGHNELAKGYSTTDAGAPEWGNFRFSLTGSKPRENSTLTLILFESSAKDGSRQHELPIPLP